MDPEGFIPIRLISSFQRVQNITTDIATIKEVLYWFIAIVDLGLTIKGVWLQAIKDSTIIEMVDDNVRCKNDPLSWVLVDGQSDHDSRFSPAGSQVLSLLMGFAFAIWPRFYVAGSGYCFIESDYIWRSSVLSVRSRRTQWCGTSAGVYFATGTHRRGEGRAFWLLAVCGHTRICTRKTVRRTQYERW